MSLLIYLFLFVFVGFFVYMVGEAFDYFREEVQDINGDETEEHY